MLHHAEPRVESKVVAGVEGVDAELVADDVGGDALDLAAGGQRVAQLHGEGCRGWRMLEINRDDHTGHKVWDQDNEQSNLL